MKNSDTTDWPALRTRKGFEDHAETERTGEDGTGHRSLSTETLVLVRSRDFLFHFWVPRRLLEHLLASVEGNAFALDPRSVATATSADMGSHTKYDRVIYRPGTCNKLLDHHA